MQQDIQTALLLLLLLLQGAAVGRIQNQEDEEQKLPTKVCQSFACVEKASGAASIKPAAT